MSSKRALRRKACSHKLRFDSESAARRAMSELHRNKGYQGFMVAYRCAFCGAFHFGHPPAKVRRAIALRG